jgi:Protein of unknown function (DUF1572)
MVKDTLSELFERDLHKLKTEVNLYKDENNLWVIREGISNSAGNLCLHLVGNLNHFIGAALGNSGYVRHRDDEFSLKNIPRRELIINIDNCILILNNTFSRLTDADLEKDFPLEKHGTIVSTMHMLLHLFGHLSYHLGQINYHRRLFD